jgi:hypothetical protein
LAQPLQAENQQQRADQHPKGIDWQEGQRRPECGDDRGQRHERREHADQRRAPLTADTYREHDGQGLDHLDG